MSETRRPDRGAHLCRLLPARQPEEPRPDAGTETHTAGDSGEALDPADGRCASAHRRAAPGAASLYTTAAGSSTPAGPAQTAVAGTTDASSARLNRRDHHLPVGAL